MNHLANGAVLHLNEGHLGQSFLEKYRHLQITNENIHQIPNETPVVTIRGVPFVCVGDVSFVSGKVKSGKTQLVAPMVATAFTEVEDSFHIKTTPHQGRLVVVLDTEQSAASCKKLTLRMLKLMGIDEIPENLWFFKVKTLSPAEKLNMVKELLKEYSLHLLIIDGVVDFTKRGANDEAEGTEIIGTLSQLAELHQTAIVGFIHENQKSESREMRGHIGSEAARKAGGVMSVRKDRDGKYHEIRCSYLRYQGDFDDVFFQWNEEAGRMITMSDEESRELSKSTKSADVKTDRMRRLANQIFAVNHSLPYKNVLDGIVNYSDKYLSKAIRTHATAKNWVTRLVEEGIIAKDEEGKYCLCPNIVNEGRDQSQTNP